MTATKKYVDGLLVHWGASLFNQRPVAAVAPKKGLSGVPLLPKKKTKSGGGNVGEGGRATAKTIRSKLGSITKKTPEVMVKISGGGKGMRQIRDHLDYITRNGKLEAEDQNENKINGRPEVNVLKSEWQEGGFAIPEDGKRKEAFNIVLSMPAGTDPLAVKRAARDFASSEFENHQYVMVLHTFETDPDPQPSPNPHVHLTVKARSFDGTRLNPRKADLQRWREAFAEKLRDHGVEAAATNRQQRLKQQERGEKQAVRQMKERGEELTKAGKGRAGAQRVAKAKKTETDVLRGYKELTKALATSDDLDDRHLALSVVRHLDDKLKDRKIAPELDSKVDKGRD